ncbi:non-canonical purine NTP pyrophosphatase [Vibrio parahaemolyticus]
MGCTSAELTKAEKQAISHRGKALTMMLEALKNA